MSSPKTLSSMTGFARVEGARAGLAWTWEAKSVNGKGLDLRCRLASGFESLEPALRQAAQKRLQRGSLQVSLMVDRGSAETGVTVNKTLLAQYLAVAQELVAQGATPPSADGLLALRGVLEVSESEE